MTREVLAEHARSQRFNLPWYVERVNLWIAVLSRRASTSEAVAGTVVREKRFTVDPLRWLTEMIEFLRFVWPMSKKDQKGKLPGFLYSPDDLGVADFFTREQIFDRRVFISFERSSVMLAEKFETALRNKGLEPWRYEPSKALKPLKEEYTICSVKEHYPETVSQLVATARRCPAALFIVSEQTIGSPLCKLEALVCGVIHSFWPDNRSTEAGIYVVLESANVALPVPLDRYWQRVYQEGLEDAIAEVVATEISRLAEILTDAEMHRAKIYY